MRHRLLGSLCRRLVVLGALVAAGLTLVACSPHPKLECGVEVEPGRARFCTRDGSQVCICATHRCAESTFTPCPSGFRYVDDGTCVDPEPLATRIDSSDPAHACPVGDADADADVEDAADACESCDEGTGDVEDGDADVAPPVVSATLRIGDGQDPRFVDFGDAGVLVAWIDRYYASWPPPASTPASAHFGLLGWGLDAGPSDVVSHNAETDFGDDVALRGAFSVADCSYHGQPGALFHYELSTPEDRPLLLYVRFDGGGLVVADVTSNVFESTPPNDIEAVRVVPGIAGRCWVVWHEDADGAAGPGAATIVARRFFDGASDGLSVPLDLTETLGPSPGTPEWRFRSAAEFEGETSPMASIPYAVVDATGALFVAVAAVDPVTHVAALFGQRVDGASRIPLWSANRSLAEFPEADYEGLENARLNAVVQVGDFAVLALVAVRSSGERHLFYDIEFLPAESSGRLDAVQDAVTNFRGPSLAALAPDLVYGAAGAWGGSPLALGSVHFFHGTSDEATGWWEALPESVTPLVVADPGTGADPRRLFVLRLAGVGSRTRLLMTRETEEGYDLAPGWIEGGIDFAPSSHTIVGEFSHLSRPLPAPDDGGALVGWTNGTAEWGAYAARIRFED